MSNGFTLWFTGLSGAGKSTLAELVQHILHQRGHAVEVLDGDEIRTHLSPDLGFTKQDRDTQVKRIGYVAKLLARNGVIAITAAISPYRHARDEVRASHDRFVEVYVQCPLETCIERDVKGLYARALRGEIPRFTGISDPYEPPLAPEIVINTAQQTPEQCAAHIVQHLEQLGFLAAEVHVG